ncbi:MAG: hypothetical protein ABJF10_15215 [Chthoniobacter sp.]|uniref:hypothetical protein n=1 Tax=Chthoniobacter sp. TaxID=2510640 RepID=UPI0032AA5945
MKPFPIIFRVAILLAFALAGVHAAETPLPLAAALAGKQLTVEANGNGRDQLSLTLRNTSPSAVTVTIPAGLIAEGREKPDCVIVLRKAEASIPAQGAVDVALPVAALSSKSSDAKQPFGVTTASEPRLAPLLDYLANQPDAPRATAQITILCLLENMSYAQWLQYLAGPAGPVPTAPVSDPHPTPAEVTQAVDVLGLLRQLAPTQTFALATDSELKLRALRNPWCRVKAMQIYGLNLGDGAVAPDLGQLLHTKPGDNCPICRQRALMEKAAGDL